MAWWLVSLPYLVRASISVMGSLQKQHKIVAGTVISIQELSGGFGFLLPRVVESSEDRTWGLYDIPKHHHFYRAVNCWTGSE
jgi:hypothetical protein